MKRNDKEKVCDICESEGFDYTFFLYSDFSDIKDKEFHRLREVYLDARNALATYIGWGYDA
jgi:hypothetical protein